MTEDENKRDFFTIFNRLLDEGWFGVLRPIDFLVWLAMLRDSYGADNETFVGAKRLARAAGHEHNGRVSESRARLAKMGLIVPLKNSKGGKTPPTYRVCLPDQKPEITKAKPFLKQERFAKPFLKQEGHQAVPKVVNQAVPKVVSENPLAVPKVVSQAVPKSGTRTEDLTEINNQHHQQQGDAAGAAADSFPVKDGQAIVEDGRRAQCDQMLRAHKVQAKKRAAILNQFPNLTPDLIERYHKEIQDKPAGVVKNPAGMLIKAIEDNAALDIPLIAKANIDQQASVEKMEADRREAKARRIVKLKAVEAECEASYLGDTFDVAGYLAEVEKIKSTHGDIVVQLIKHRLQKLGAFDSAWDKWPDDFSHSAGTVLAVEQYRTGETPYFMRQLNVYAVPREKRPKRVTSPTD